MRHPESWLKAAAGPHYSFKINKLIRKCKVWTDAAQRDVRMFRINVIEKIIQKRYKTNIITIIKTEPGSFSLSCFHCLIFTCRGKIRLNKRKVRMCLHSLNSQTHAEINQLMCVLSEAGCSAGSKILVTFIYSGQGWTSVCLFKETSCWLWTSLPRNPVTWYKIN